MQSSGRLSENYRILVVIKGALDRAVPIISVARHFAAHGHIVHITCGTCGSSLRELLEAEGIKVTALMSEHFRDNGTLLRKVGEWSSFRRRAGEVLRRSTPDITYIGSADTAISLTGLLKPHRYILHLRELHDQQPLYMKSLRPIARGASRVVVPEINRAFLYQNILQLKRLPRVLPNKPFSHPRQRNLDIGFLPGVVQQELASNRVLLYQGLIHSERNLRPALRAVAANKRYKVVLLGKDYGPLADYREIIPDLVHIPFVEPPKHLNITSWAHVGLLTYDTLSLNTIYCAPNKIWEFSGFGIPMLCSENPGLRYTVGQFGSGKVANFNSKSDILTALDCIDADYDAFKQKAHAFFNGTDTGEILNQLIRDVA